MSSNTSAPTTLQLYGFVPNRGASVFFAIAFGVLTTALLVVLHQASSHYTVSFNKSGAAPRFSKKHLALIYLPLIIGCLFEVIGFICRCVSVFSRANLDAFIGARVCILMGPSLFMTTMYILFSRLLEMIDLQQHFLFSNSVNRRVFIMGNIAGSILQGIGAGLTGSYDTYHTGKALLIAGLFVQIGIFTVFVLREWLMFRVVHSDAAGVAHCTVKWRQLNIVLLVSGALIMVRSIVRLVEVFEGVRSAILLHEWYTYVFDTLPMVLLVVLYAASTPICSMFHVQQEVVNFLVGRSTV